MLRSLHKVPECIVALLVDLRCADGHGVMAMLMMKSCKYKRRWKLNEIVSKIFLLQVLYEMYKLNLNLTIKLIVTKGIHHISVISRLAKIQSVILFRIIDYNRISPLNAASCTCCGSQCSSSGAGLKYLELW